MIFLEDFQCVCPEPSTIPAGYQRGPMGWECAALYIGEAIHSCSTSVPRSKADLKATLMKTFFFR